MEAEEPQEERAAAERGSGVARVVYLFGPDSPRLMRVGASGAPAPADTQLAGSGTPGLAALPEKAPHLHRFLTESLGWSGERELPSFDSLLAFIDLETARRKGHNRESLERARREAWLAAVRTLEAAVRERPCPLHVRLMSALNDGDAVISMSRPVLLDRAIDAARSGATDDPASLAWSYGIGFRKELGPTGWREPPGAERRSLHLLKLRGSFNWLRCGGCRADYLFDLEHPHPDAPGFRFPCVHPASAFEPLWLLARAAQGGRPISIAQVWTEAIRALESADEVVILGDPLLDGDLAVEWLIRHSIAARGADLVVKLVPSEPRCGEELSRILEEGGLRPEILSIERLASAAAPPRTLF